MPHQLYRVQHRDLENKIKVIQSNYHFLEYSSNDVHVSVSDFSIGTIWYFTVLSGFGIGTILYFVVLSDIGIGTICYSVTLSYFGSDTSCFYVTVRLRYWLHVVFCGPF